MLSLHKHNWIEIGIDSILTNKDSEGVRYLQHFLKDYSQLTSTQVNAGCNKCIAKYYNNYINLLSDMENDCEYRLHKKREGIPLAFGSNIRVTNRNITNDYADVLIKKYKAISKEFQLSDIFSKFPIEVIEVKKEITKPRRKKRTKK